MNENEEHQVWLSVYHHLASAGLCDAPGSCEERRLWKEWLLKRRRRAMASFIVDEANAPPATSEESGPIAHDGGELSDA